MDEDRTVIENQRMTAVHLSHDCQQEQPAVRVVPRRAPESQPAPDAAYFLRTALELVTNDRAVDYGDMVENHKNIMRLWNAFLFPREPGHELTLVEVPVLMILMKIARLRQGSIKADTFADICGYGAIAGRLAFIESS